jgi:hypothetical protein
MQWILGLVMSLHLAQTTSLKPTVILSQEAWSGYQFYLLSMGSGTGTFAVSPDGKGWGFSYCETSNCTHDTRSIALTKCKARSGFDCIVFALGNQIQVEYSVP